MFKKNQYITRGIANSCSIRLISIIWKKLYEANRKLDYFQIFEFKECQNDLKVLWKQEGPFHVESFIIPNEKVAINSLWVICSGENSEDEYSTMLLPNEY